MLELADELLDWHNSGQRFAVATVIATFSSAPRSTGAAMAVSETGEVLGSISGGCLEAAVVALAETALATGQPVRERFGVGDEDGFAIGLTCGGTIDVFVAPVKPSMVQALRYAQTSARESLPTVVATFVDGPGAGRYFSLHEGSLVGTTKHHSHEREIVATLTDALESGGRGLVQVSQPNAAPAMLFVEALRPRPRMIIFGAVDFTRALSHLAKLLGFDVTVCDARAVFATKERFPHADRVVVDWPHRFLSSEAADLDERTVVCVMTHNPRFDIPLLQLALTLPIAYVGAMGSRQVSADRAEQLRALGVSESQLTRLRAPIGLDIGGTTPMEAAVSVVAEIIATRERRSAQPLMSSHGRIHSDQHTTGLLQRASL